MSKEIASDISQIYRCPATSKELSFVGSKDTNGLNTSYIYLDLANIISKLSKSSI